MIKYGTPEPITSIIISGTSEMNLETGEKFEKLKESEINTAPESKNSNKLELGNKGN